MDTKLNKLLEKSAIRPAVMPMTDAMCGEIASLLVKESDYLIAVPSGQERVSVAVGILEKMLPENSPVWYLSPTEMLAVYQKFHFSSVFSDDSGVSLMSVFQRENPDAQIVIWSADMLLNAMADLDTLSKPALLVIDHGELLNHPETGSLVESILLSFPLNIPVLFFTGQPANPESLTAYLARSRSRPCRYMESGDISRNVIPAFLSSDWEMSVLTDKKRLAGKVKRIIKEDAGFKDIRFTDFIQKLVDLLRTEQLLPALILLPWEKECDMAVDCCKSVRQEAGNILTATSVSTILDNNPLLKENPILQNTLSKGAASFHSGHSPVWLQLVGQLLAFNCIDVLFATPESVSDLDHRINAAVLCMLPRQKHETIPTYDLWQIERIKGFLGRDRAGLFAAAHTPDADPVRFKDQLTNHRLSVKSAFRCTSRIVLGLLSSGDKKRLPGPVNCSLFAIQNPSDINLSGQHSPGKNTSFEELDAELKEQLPEACCAAYLQTVHMLIDMHITLSIRIGHIGLKKGLHAEREVRSLENMISRLPCPACTHFSLCHKRGSKRFRNIMEQYNEMKIHHTRDIEELRTDVCRHLECLQEFELANAAEKLTSGGRFALRTGLNYPQSIMECLRQNILPFSDPDMLFALVGGFCVEHGNSGIPVSEGVTPFYRQIEEVYNNMEPVLNMVQERMLRFGLLPPEYSLSSAAFLLAYKKGSDTEISGLPSGLSIGRLEWLARKSLYLLELIHSHTRQSDNSPPWGRSEKSVLYRPHPNPLFFQIS